MTRASYGTPRPILADEAKDLTPITIARDGLAVVVNPANPVNELKIEQIRGKTPAQFTFTFRWNVNSSTP